MDDEEAARVLNSHIERVVSARLLPVAGMIMGAELVIIHIFNLLHRDGAITKAGILKSLRATREALPPNALPSTAMFLRHLETGIESSNPAGERAASNDQTARRMLQLLQGGLSEEAPPDTDRTDPTSPPSNG